MSISLDMDTFKAHLKRMSKDGYVLHELDKDLLLQKTRELYDNIHQLETSGKEEIFKEEISVIEVEEPIKEPIEEIAEVKIEEKVIELKPEIPEVEVKKEEPKKFENEVLDIEENEDVIIEENPAEEVELIVPTEENQSPPEKDEASAIDLFSVSKETISDKFVVKDEKNLADKLQQNNLTDLRAAIGINEKFLFINELFNGDMGRYNKILDELNSMQSKTGLDTYLMELKIEKQWNEDMEAYVKFKELVDRKFV